MTRAIAALAPSLAVACPPAPAEPTYALHDYTPASRPIPLVAAVDAYGVADRKGKAIIAP